MLGIHQDKKKYETTGNLQTGNMERKKFNIIFLLFVDN